MLCDLCAVSAHASYICLKYCFVYFSAAPAYKRSTTQNDYSTSWHRCRKILCISVYIVVKCLTHFDLPWAHKCHTQYCKSSCSSRHRRYQLNAKPNNDNTRQTNGACRRQGWHPRSSITVQQLLLLYSTWKDFFYPKAWQLCKCVRVLERERKRKKKKLWFESHTKSADPFSGVVWHFVLSSGHSWWCTHDRNADPIAQSTHHIADTSVSAGCSCVNSKRPTSTALKARVINLIMHVEPASWNKNTSALLQWSAVMNLCRIIQIFGS